MNSVDVLPEEWLEVASKRRSMYRIQQVRNIVDKKLSVEKCIGCPFLRARNDTYHVYTWCVVNKCIKQYPVYSDRERFT